ncbi:hypothetical protein ACH429_24485 [Streptomyces pathocidini]|uniref:Uncharacterized protein n=1 Tax=Streptomyces pathocidini TaxID=1650571 RepID=A0ABW7UXC9_9ACTN
MSDTLLPDIQADLLCCCASLTSGAPGCFGNWVTVFNRGSLPKNARYFPTVPISLTIFFAQADV